MTTPKFKMFKCYFFISSPKLLVVSIIANQFVLINVNSVNEGRIFKIKLEYLK
jgi:hypothetical protein